MIGAEVRRHDLFIASAHNFRKGKMDCAPKWMETLEPDDFGLMIIDEAP